MLWLVSVDSKLGHQIMKLQEMARLCWYLRALSHQPPTISILNPTIPLQEAPDGLESSKAGTPGWWQIIDIWWEEVFRVAWNAMCIGHWSLDKDWYQCTQPYSSQSNVSSELELRTFQFPNMVQLVPPLNSWSTFNSTWVIESRKIWLEYKRHELCHSVHMHHSKDSIYCERTPTSRRSYRHGGRENQTPLAFLETWNGPTKKLNIIIDEHRRHIFTSRLVTWVSESSWEFWTSIGVRKNLGRVEELWKSGPSMDVANLWYSDSSIINLRLCSTVHPRWTVEQRHLWRIITMICWESPGILVWLSVKIEECGLSKRLAVKKSSPQHMLPYLSSKIFENLSSKKHCFQIDNSVQISIPAQSF